MNEHLPPNQNRIEIKELIRRIQDELMESQMEREEKGISPLFEVDSLDIEIQFILKEDAKIQGKIDLIVLSFGGDTGLSKQSIHTLKLHLKAAKNRYLEVKGTFPRYTKNRVQEQRDI